MSTAPPNLVVFICDDLADGDLACHGNPYTRTPHLDRLHHEGTRLTRYCSGPLCTPARAALMTGRHPYRTRAIDTYLGRSTIDPGEVTLPEVLQQAGYATGLFGKWHLGDTHPCRPEDKGFAEAFYHLGGGLQQPGNVGRPAYFDPDLVHNGELVPTQGYCNDRFADAAVAFVESHHAVPFFCYFATNLPHSPFEIAEEWIEPYRAMGLPEKLARVYAMVENIDHHNGRVLQAIDRLGLREQTLVLFTSDHGPCGSAHIDGRPRFNRGWRGFKSQMYEGGLRVPALLRWSGVLDAGRDLDRLTNPIDWLPTFAAACGVPLPSDRVIDGANLWPLLTGQVAAEDWPDRSIPIQWHRGDLPVRYRNAANLHQRLKWYRPAEDAPDELYDVAADPSEEHNLAASQPEATARLRAEYDAWFDDVSATHGATPAENYARPRIVIGAAAQPRTCLTWQDWRRYDDREGWTEDLPGYWPVTIAATGDYAVTIDLAPQAAEQPLHFGCGPTERVVPLLPHLATVSFDRLHLEAGDWNLEAWLGEDAPRVGVRYVHVRRAE